MIGEHYRRTDLFGSRRDGELRVVVLNEQLLNGVRDVVARQQALAVELPFRAAIEF